MVPILRSLVMDIQVLKVRELQWRISMRQEYQKLMVKWLRSLAFLMVCPQLSSLINSMPHSKSVQGIKVWVIDTLGLLPTGSDDDGLDDDLDEVSDSEDESEYDDLPPFRSLTKAQLGKLNKAQKKSCFEELELRKKHFMKKQLKEEKRRRKMMKKMVAIAKDLPNEYNESVKEESGGLHQCSRALQNEKEGD